jgi:hypothetical protein
MSEPNEYGEFERPWAAPQRPIYESDAAVPQSETLGTLPEVPPPAKGAEPSRRPEYEPAVTQSNPVQDRLRERLLRMAETYKADGAVRQAMSLFLTLVEDYPDTLEAARAVHRLLAIADDFEAVGEFRQARSIYERIC